MFNKKTRMSFIQLILSLCFLAFSLPLSQAADITLTVGDGSGSPGSGDNQVTVSLENQNDKVKGVQMDICDEGDYLSCSECEVTERSTGLICETNEVDGCCRVLLISLSGDLIEEGTGSIFTLEYNVSEEAPVGDCIDLSLEKEKVSGESGEISPEEVAVESGKFCFLASSTTTTTTICPCMMKEIYSKNSEEVKLLRNFRDQVLSKTQSGRELIRLYYQLSPAVVKLIEEDELLREKLIRLYYYLSPTIMKVIEEDESFREGLTTLYYQWWGPAVVKAIEEDKRFRGEVKKIIDGTLPLIKGEAE